MSSVSTSPPPVIARPPSQRQKLKERIVAASEARRSEPGGPVLSVDEMDVLAGSPSPIRDAVLEARAIEWEAKLSPDEVAELRSSILTVQEGIGFLRHESYEQNDLVTARVLVRAQQALDRVKAMSPGEWKVTPPVAAATVPAVEPESGEAPEPAPPEEAPPEPTDTVAADAAALNRARAIARQRQAQKDSAKQSEPSGGLRGSLQNVLAKLTKRD